jgi:hypothetical protein
MASVSVMMANGRWPPSRACTIGAPPRYGTHVIAMLSGPDSANAWLAVSVNAKPAHPAISGGDPCFSSPVDEMP